MDFPAKWEGKAREMESRKAGGEIVSKAPSKNLALWRNSLNLLPCNAGILFLISSPAKRGRIKEGAKFALPSLSPACERG